MGRPSLSRNIKFSGANEDGEKKEEQDWQSYPFDRLTRIQKLFFMFFFVIFQKSTFSPIKCGAHEKDTKSRLFPLLHRL